MVFEWRFCLSCGRCCLNTEMILLKEDISRIESLGIDRDYFVEYREGFPRLRNVDGHCIFYDIATGRCRIYRHRPLGCRIYPLIFDEEKGIYLDPECPLHSLATCRDILEGISLLKRFLEALERDYGYRINWKLFKESYSRILYMCKDHI